MPIACPKCSQQLPEVETLEYRFCPHCGAEIPTDPRKSDDAFLTLPPDMSLRQPKKTAKSLRPETCENESVTRQFNDQTIEPQAVTKRSHPKIKPPETPPPVSFLRVSFEKKAPPPEDIKKQSPAKSRRNVIVVVLVLLAAVILIMGGFFTF